MIAENDSESEFQRWASEQLELPHDAPPEAVRNAFLRRLWADRFCPPTSIHQAYEILRDGNNTAAAKLPPGDEAWLEAHQRVRAKVDQFASEFFQTPPDARQVQWEKLARLAAPFPRIDSRLRKLEYGLTTDLKQEGDDAAQVDRLARACCALFVLRPTAQAMLRQSLEAEFADEASQWASAAKILRAQSPDIAALAPYLMEWLVNYAERNRQTARAHDQAASARAPNWAPQPTRITRQPQESSRHPLIRILVVVLIFSGFHALRSYSTNHSNRPNVEYHTPVMPTVEFPREAGKPTIETVDTSLIPPTIQTQAVELRDEIGHRDLIKAQRETERLGVEIVLEIIRREKEKLKQNQGKPAGNSDVRTSDVPDPARKSP